MDFGINPHNADLVERAKTYAREMLAPRAEEIDQEGKFPRENFRDLAAEDRVGVDDAVLSRADPRVERRARVEDRPVAEPAGVA